MVTITGRYKSMDKSEYDRLVALFKQHFLERDTNVLYNKWKPIRGISFDVIGRI